MNRLLFRGLATAFFTTFLLAVQKLPASAEIDLFDINGAPVTASGWMRTREYVWSFFQAGPIGGKSYQNSYNYQANVLRLGLGYATEDFKLFTEFEDPALLNLPSSAIAPPPPGALGLGGNYYQPQQESSDASIFLKQGFVEFGSRILQGLNIKGGRFEFNEGQDLMPSDPQLRWIVNYQISQRLIGNFGFSDVMRSFDGAVTRYGDANWNVTAMYGVPTRGVFDLNGWDEIRKTDVVYAALNGQRAHRYGNALGRIFFIWYDDNRGLVPVDNQPASAAAKNRSAIGIETAGADAAATVQLGPGTADAMVWGAYQFGDWGSQSQQAYASVAQMGYRLNDFRWKPWLRFTWQMASGDSNPNNNVHGTFFQILPTPRMYALNPIYNMMNNIDAGSELILSPLANLESRTTMHALWLSSSYDRWYAGGGAFDSHLFGYTARPSFGKSYLGTELDTGLLWKVSKYLSASIFAGHFFGGSVAAANFPQGRGETFGYVESLLSF
ncbi:MAG TPA: alginate export family protein [Candidatus Binataceae bacterium]|nr:alginate export family protein [Candidatus Binataceae bacterium]